MTAVVFAGPSLAGGPLPPHPGVALRPPAEAGDLYRAARDGATVIGLVDGVFEDRATVWHKEILWALDRGARVIGAASLGALRAVECAPFGMEGVGAIHARCARGELEDDHELALVHAPPELGYAPVSEPLVNVRATLDAAADQGLVPRPRAAALLRRALAMPYKALTWRALLVEAEAAGWSAGERARFAAWLPQGRVDLKRADALLLLAAVAAAAAAPDPPPARSFQFSDTRYWRAAVESFERGAAVVAPADQAVLDELRLQPAGYERAMVRALARRAARGAPPAADPAALIEELRLDEGLATAAAFHGWCAALRTDEDRVAAALAAEERLLFALEADAAALAPAVLDALRVDGRYARLDQRAAAKRDRLAEMPEPVFRETEIPGLVAALCARARVRIDSDDPDAVARALGLADRRALHRLLAREEAYLAAEAAP